MSNSRFSATVKNFLVTIVFQLITIGFGFLIPRMFLETYGPSIHGLTSTITSIMSYVVLLSAGLSTASLHALYLPLSRKDNDGINAVLNAVDRFYKQIGIAYSIAVFVIAMLLPYAVGSQVPHVTVISLMLVMGSTSIIESFLYSKYRVLLMADQKLYLVSWVNILAIVIRGILQISLINQGASVVVVEAIVVAMVLLRMIILKRYVDRNYTFLSSKVRPNLSALSQRWSAFAHQIAGLVVNNTDVLILTFFGNLTLVSIYAVYQLVFNQLYTLMTTVFSQSSVASFGYLMSTNQTQSVINNYNKYELLYYTAISIVYSICAIMILPFVKLYTLEIPIVHYVDVKLAVLFVLIGVVNNLRVPGGTLINAGGLYKETQWRAITEAIINITVSLILVNYFGIYGVLLGTVSSFAYRTIDIILYSNIKVLGQSPIKTLKRSARVVIIICINVLIFNELFVLSVNKWFEWLLQSILVGGCSFVITIVVNLIFDRSSTLDLFKLVKSLIYRRKMIK